MFINIQDTTLLTYLLHLLTVSLARVLSQKLEIACQYCSLIHPKALGHFLVYSKYSTAFVEGLPCQSSG